MVLRAPKRLSVPTVATNPPRAELTPRDTSKLFGRDWRDSLPSNDLREFRRIQVSWPSTILEKDAKSSATVTDISLGGARAKTIAFFSLDQTLLLDIHGITKLFVSQLWAANGEIGLQFVASPSLISEKLPPQYADLLGN